MKKKKKWIKWVVILVIVAAVVGWFMMVSRKTQDVAYTNVQATLGSIETYYNFDGLVKAKRVQTITAAQSDKVRTVYVTQNQQVKKGERLYRLEGGETVEADIAGEVTGLYVEQGGVVTAGETTAQIIDMNSLEIELNVDEYDVAAVVPGQVVQVNVLAPDVSFTGSVTALNKNGTASGDLSYYTATVAFDAAENVYPGMQVSAKVLKEQAEDAVLLRQDAVQFDDYNKPYVLVRGGWQERGAKERDRRRKRRHELRNHQRPERGRHGAQVLRRDDGRANGADACSAAHRPMSGGRYEQRLFQNARYCQAVSDGE